jgi:hypothetical protein
VGDNLADTFRLIQEQAISAVLGDTSGSTSDEGPETPTTSAGKSNSDLTFPGDSLQETSSLPRHNSSVYYSYNLIEMSTETSTGELDRVCSAPD